MSGDLKTEADKNPSSYKMYGWFDSADQKEPSYAPPKDAPCHYCGKPCTIDDVRCHSFMCEDNPKRSFFFRTHRTCDAAAQYYERESLYTAMIDQIEKNKDV